MVAANLRLKMASIAADGEGLPGISGQWSVISKQQAMMGPQPEEPPFDY
jgi:hypothetical protein